MDVSKLSPGKNAPKVVNVVIEISEDSAVKYEVDKESGALFVDRFLFTAMHYPFNYGFIPGTLADDGDPVDVLVMSGKPVIPGSVVSARPIGMLMAEDEKGKDEKIVAVPTSDLDPHYDKIKDINDLPEILHRKIEHFFAHYKDLEPGKWMKLREWKSAEKAEEYIRKSLK